MGCQNQNFEKVKKINSHYLRDDFKTQPPVDRRFRLVSIDLNNDNRPETDGTASQPAVGFWSRP